MRVPPLCNVPNMYRKNVAFLIGGSDLYHGGRTIGGRERAAVGFSDAGVAGENVGAAVLTAEHRPFGEYRETAQCRGTAGADHRVRQNAVVEGDVDTVVIPVKGDRLHIDVGVQKLGAAYPHVGGVVERLLGTGGEIDPQVFHAVLIPAGVGYLPCVNGHGLTQILRIAAQDVRTLLRHGNPS